MNFVEKNCTPEYLLFFHSQESILDLKNTSLSYQKSAEIASMLGSSLYHFTYQTKTSEKTASQENLQNFQTLKEKYQPSQTLKSITFEKKVFSKPCTFADGSQENGIFEKYSYDIKNKTLKKEYSEHTENLCEKKEVTLPLLEETQKSLQAHLGKISLQEYIKKDPVTGGEKYILTLTNTDEKTISYDTKTLIKTTPQASFALREDHFKKILAFLTKINP